MEGDEGRGGEGRWRDKELRRGWLTEMGDGGEGKRERDLNDISIESLVFGSEKYECSYHTSYRSSASERKEINKRRGQRRRDRELKVKIDEFLYK